MAFTDWIADEQEEVEVTEVNETVEETEEIENTEETIEEVTEESTVVESVVDAPATVEKINVNGQELTLDEIQQGYMRQQDYIAQREEINKLRDENKQALELVEYLRKNPELANRLMTDEQAPSNVTNVINPAMERVEKLERELYTQKLNNSIEALKSKYPDFNEIEVLDRAVKMNIHDLEFVYNGMRGQNIENIISQRVKDELTKASAEMQKNAQTTRTVVGNAKHTDVSVSHNLTQQQMRVADMMNISYDDYAKYL